MADYPPSSPDLLESLTAGERDAVLAISARRRYIAGDLIFLEGDAADALYLLTEGRVGVRVSTPDGDVVTLTVLGPGDCFGEIALVGGTRRRTATIVALEPVETRVVGRREFEALRKRDPAVERFLVGVLAQQVARLTTQVIEALYMPVEIRLNRRLCQLAVLYGEGKGSGAPPPWVVPLTQADLASLAGTSRQTCNRILRDLADQGVLRLGRGRTTITDLARLRRLAGV